MLFRSAEQKAALAAAKQMETLHQAKQQTGMGFQDFCGQVTKDPDTAKQMNDLWLIYSSGGSASGKAALRNRASSEISIIIPAVPEQTPDETQTPEQPQPPEDTQTPEQSQLPETPAGTPEEPESLEEQPLQELSEAESPEVLRKGQMSARLVEIGRAHV